MENFPRSFFAFHTNYQTLISRPTFCFMKIWSFPPNGHFPKRAALLLAIVVPLRIDCTQQPRMGNQQQAEIYQF